MRFNYAFLTVNNPTNWELILPAGGSLLLIERENHSHIAWLSDGTSITNNYQSGMTTFTVLMPGETWTFNAAIPSSAIEVQVMIYAHRTSKLRWRIFPG